MACQNITVMWLSKNYLCKECEVYMNFQDPTTVLVSFLWKLTPVSNTNDSCLLSKVELKNKNKKAIHEPLGYIICFT